MRLLCNPNRPRFVIMSMKLICLLIWLALLHPYSDWFQKKEEGFVTCYKAGDSQYINEYNLFIRKGFKKVKTFFSSSYKNEFVVYVHPDRQSLDSTWQHDWKMPEFKSECWMVASGIANRLDMISPAKWTTQSCEHDYSNREETQRLITHELVHIYHAQHNKSKDFSESENMDWFAEGLATYASGQLTTTKLEQVKQAVKENNVPGSLNDFWKGKMRYQLSGSVILFIDKTYGRKKLISLLPFTKLSEVLSELDTTEEKLLARWNAFFLNQTK